MFIATMYSYGTHGACVGVDGIITCMGVFLSHGGALYAIHIPDNSKDVNAQGREAFATYVEMTANNYKGKHARLYAVVNNGPRNGAEDEVRGIAKRLGIKGKEATFIRLGNSVAGQAAAVIGELAPNGSSVIVKFQPHATANWQQGGLGVARAGYYKNPSFNSIFSVPSTSVAAGWALANYSNSDLCSL